MNKKTMKDYKQRLLDAKREIITKLMQDDNDYDHLKEEDIGDMVDVAYKNYEKDLLFGMSQAEKTILEMIDAALDRIEQNEYGKCIRCGNEIETKRLDIMPYAPKCINCKTHEEKHGIGPGYSEEEPVAQPAASSKRTRSSSAKKAK